MHNYVIGKLVIPVFICYFLLTQNIFSDTNQEYLYLTKVDREKYQEVNYETLKINTKKYRKKKLKLTINYDGEESYQPYLYREQLPTKRYFYLEIRSYSGNKILILFSRKKRKKLISLLAGLQKGTTIALYGGLKKISGVKRRQRLNSGYSEYYFLVEDIDAKAVSSEIPITDSKDFNPGSYQEVKAKNLDLLASKYIDQKIRFKFKYQGRRSEVDHMFQKLFPNDKFFQFNTNHYYVSSGGQIDSSLRAFALITSKTDQKIVEKVLDLNNGSLIEAFGTLKKHTDTRYSPPMSKYYIYIDKILRNGETFPNKEKLKMKK